MTKNIQISTDLFLELCEYFSREDTYGDYNADCIRKQLNDKLDKMIDRAVYSKYKRATDPAEREAYRRQYLDRRMVPDGFRSDVEVPYTYNNPDD